MEKRKKTNIILLTIIAAIVVIFGTIATSEENDTSGTVIPGLNCYSAKEALKEMGFSTQRNTSEEMPGVLWTCNRRDADITYIVQIYAPEYEDAESFRVSVMADGENIGKGLSMLKELAGVFYNTADYRQAATFVEENYNNEGATTVIGDAQFVISAPTPLARMLSVTKYSGDPN